MLVRMPSLVFGLLCILSAVCGGATAVGVSYALTHLLALSGSYPTPLIFLVLFFVFLVSPPVALVRLRREQRTDYGLLKVKDREFGDRHFGAIEGRLGAPARVHAVDPKGYYAVLGLDRSANPDVIKAAYRALVKHFHPDAGAAVDANGVRFRAINEAYRVLGDPEERTAYDRLRTTEADNALVLVTPGMNEVAYPEFAASAPHAGEESASRVSRRGPGWSLLGMGAAGAIAIAGIGGLLGYKYGVSPAPKVIPPPVIREVRTSIRLCIAPIDGPTEVFSTVPTLQLDKYRSALESGTGTFIFDLNGTQAAAQLGFNRRFAIAYGEVLERAKAAIAKNGTATIAEIIAFFGEILREEQLIDQLIRQRARQYSAIIFLRALQDGYCAFPNAYADNVPSAEDALAQVAKSLPRIALNPSDDFFASLYDKEMNRVRDEGRQPNGTSLEKIVGQLRHEIVSSGR